MDSDVLGILGSLLALVILDLAVLRFGWDSRSGAREMPGAGDRCGKRRPPFPRASDRTRRRLVWSSSVPNHALHFPGRDWATAPPLQGLLRLRPPASAIGYARLDLAALGK